MAALGLLATFLPQELAAAAGVPHPPVIVLLVIQIAGALYLGAAAQNWFARQSTMGGIYNRPLALANLLHFLVVAIALVKLVMAGQRDTAIVGLTVVYGLFAIAFAAVTFNRAS